MEDDQEKKNLDVKDKEIKKDPIEKPREIETEIKEDEETEKGVQELEQHAVYLNISLYNCDIRDSVLGSTNPIVYNHIPRADKQLQGFQDQSKYTKPTHLNKQSFPEWFYTLSDAAQVFALSVAIFSGNNLEYIVHASDRLLEILNRDRGKNEEASTSIFGKRPIISELLSTTQTQIFSIQSEGTKTSAVSETVCFISSDISQFIFDLAKNDPNFIRITPKLIEWLTAVINTDAAMLNVMGSGIPELAWSQAGIGIGSFIRKDFASKMRRTIDQWAVSTNFRLRLMVGWIFLGISADSTESHFQSVSKILLDWMNSKNSFLRWTTVAALGKLCLLSSETNPQIMRFALEIIHRAMTDTSIAVKKAANITLRVIYRYSWYHAKSVVLTLSDWLVPGDHIRNDSIAEAAIELFGEAISFTSTNEEHFSKQVSTLQSGSIFSFPNSSDSIIRETVTTLLRQSFSHRSGSFVDHAINKFVQCLVQADKERTYTSSKNVGYVISDLYNDPSTTKIIRHILGLPAANELTLFK